MVAEWSEGFWLLASGFGLQASNTGGCPLRGVADAELRVESHVASASGTSLCHNGALRVPARTPAGFMFVAGREQFLNRSRVQYSNSARITNYKYSYSLGPIQVGYSFESGYGVQFIGQ